MADPPRYPGTDVGHGAGRHQEPANGRTGWGTLVAMVLVSGLVLLVIVLHLSGTVGPGAH